MEIRKAIIPASSLGTRFLPATEAQPKGNAIESELFQIHSFAEKLKKEEEPSRYAIMGRYISNHEIIEILETIPARQGDELQLTDAINELIKQHAVLEYNFERRRYDICDKIGFIKAITTFP